MSDITTQPQRSHLDTLLTVLADEARRIILTYLRHAPSATASFEDLTTALITNTDLDQERARIRLHHTHLPSLVNAGLISYDTATTTVEYRGHRALEAIMEAFSDPVILPRE